MGTYQTWQHVFKLDPNKTIGDRDLERICESGTDAVIVGGTDGVTLDNTLYLLSRIRQHTVDCALEISTLDAVTPGFDDYLIPTVLNAGESSWITGKHQEAVKQFGDIIDWESVLVEGYCVLNPDSRVAGLTKARANLSAEDIASYAVIAEKMFHLPIFYLEYSGMFGDMKAVQTVKEKLNHTRLFYGGGIGDERTAREAAKVCDTVVVGNLIYENPEQALKTVEAVKRVKEGKDIE